MAVTNWHYKETLRRCHTFLINNFNIHPQVDSLAQDLYDRKHITYVKRRKIRETVSKTEKIRILLDVLIEGNTNAEDWYGCFIEKLNDLWRGDIITKLDDTLAIVKTLTEQPQENVETENPMSWYYKETLRRCNTFLINEYNVPPQVHSLSQDLYDRNHITYTDNQTVHGTLFSTEKTQVLLDMLIKGKTNPEDWYECLIKKFTEYGRHDIVTQLEDTLAIVKTLTERPEEHILDTVNRIRGNVENVSPTEIDDCLTRVAEYIAQSQAEGRAKSFGAHTDAVVPLPETAYNAYTRLIQACQGGHVQKLQDIIGNYPECINGVNDKGESALMVACNTSHVDIVKALLSFPTINPNLKDVNGHTALMKCMLRGDPDILDAMLADVRVDITEADMDGLTYQWYLFGDDIRKQLLILALLLVKKTSEIINKWNILEVDLLMYIAKIKEEKERINWEDIVQMVDCLLSHDKVNHTGLLKLCLTIGNADVVEQVLKSGKVGSLNDIIGYSYSATAINPEIVAVLIEENLIIWKRLSEVHIGGMMEFMIRYNDRDLCNMMYDMVQEYKSQGKTVNEALETVLLVQSKAPAVLRQRVKANKCDLNTTDPAGNSAFSIVCKYGGKGTVSKLLELPDINADMCNNKGQTSFMLSLMNSDQEVAKILWNSKRLNIEVNQCDNQNTSTLAYACVSSNEDIVKVMLNCSEINVNLMDDRGYTALSYVCLSGMEHMAEELIDLDIMLVTKRKNIAQISKRLFTETGEAKPIPADDFEQYDLKDFDSAYTSTHRIVQLAPIMHKFLKRNNSNIATMLLDMECIDLTVNDKDGNTLLMLACIWGDVKVISRLVESLMVEVDAENSTGKTALILACISGKLEVVNYLLKHGAMVNKANKNQNTPLMLTCYLSNIPIASQLILEGANLNANNIDGTPLMIASMYDSTKMMELLLGSGALLDTRNVIGETALVFACLYGKPTIVNLLLSRKAALVDIPNRDGYTPLMTVCAFCCNNSGKIVEILLRHNAKVDLLNSDGNTALLHACWSRAFHTHAYIRKLCWSKKWFYSRSDNDKIVQQLLLKSTAEVNVAGEFGNTPLIGAICSKNLPIVLELLKADADVDGCNLKKQTPLYLACVQSTEEIVELLLSSNADPNIGDEYGSTPLIPACARKDGIRIIELLIGMNVDINKGNLTGCTPLMVASYHGNVDIVDVLLCKGAKVEIGDKHGNTALLMAAAGNVEVTEMLIFANADTNQANEYGETPLMAACYKDNIQLIPVLLRHNAEIDKANEKGNTPLLEACKHENIDIVTLLLQSKADINKADNIGGTPLIAACLRGNSELVELLLNHGAQANMADHGGDTPLNYACNSNKTFHMRVVWLLIEAGADINQRSLMGNTPIMVAIHNRNVPLVRLLLKKRAEVNVPSGFNALQYACRIKDMNTTIVQLLIDANAELDPSDLTAKTPLFTAIKARNAEIVFLLLWHKVDVDRRSKMQRTCLMTACLEGDITIVDLLIRGRAEVNTCDIGGNTPLIYACGGNNVSVNIVRLLVQAGAGVNTANKTQITPLLAVCYFSQHAGIVDLLLRSNAHEKGDTPLILVCRRANINHMHNVVELLLNAKANVNQSNSWDNTALMLASKRSDVKVVTSLLNHDAEVNAADKDGDTPLLYACGCDGNTVNVDVVELLIKAEADMNVRNKKGMTPLMTACSGGHVRIVQLLLRYEVDVSFPDINGLKPLECAGRARAVLVEAIGRNAVADSTE